MPGRKAISEEDLVDLKGKVAIVTGGNTGVGYATIQMLARKGAKVYMAARNEGKATEAIKQLQAEGISDVHWLNLDLSDPRRAQSAGKEFLEKEKRLDILVNNAAIGAVGPYKLNKDGLLDIMVTNHISHFVLTETVLPLMKTTAKETGSDVRIVNVTSIAHDRVKPESYTSKEALNKDYGESFGGYLDTYGNSKLANILHIKELQRRLNSESISITCIATHPGAIKTNVLGPLFFAPWRKGAMTVGFGAAGKEVKEQSETYQGAYLAPIAAITTPSKYALDERLAKELHETTENIVKELGL
ncbi:hypothetical protein D9758_002229 [Tetrapyrgos nigripes]|uniref:NAD(P)-binding protein n=1 Tax=Tetrapyrgos nigripes TaxID=182062 RepID=A0A8H5GP76_9AGAR|nr:hypothetical protein D9758_002229 [Tetrapyrgos nigripes]